MYPNLGSTIIQKPCWTYSRLHLCMYCYSQTDERSEFHTSASLIYQDVTIIPYISNESGFVEHLKNLMKGSSVYPSFMHF